MIYLQECQCAIIDFYCSIDERCIITRNFDFYNKMGLESVYWFYDGDFIPSTFSAFVYKRNLVECEELMWAISLVKFNVNYYNNL